MNNCPLIAGNKFIGKLDMFGVKFDYEFAFEEIKEDGSFNFCHKVSTPGICADVKLGTGQIDIDGQVEISYEDPETSFEGIYNPNTEIFKGQSKQLAGVYSSTKGNFVLKLI